MPAWHGQLEVQLEFSHGTQEYYFQGLGLFLLRGLGWDTTEIAREIRGQILIGDGMVQLRDLTGALGEGTLGGQLHLNWRHPERSWSSLNLYRVEAARLLAPWPALASALKGPVEVRLRASLGREWRGTADVNLGRGTLWGVEIVDWRLPLSFSFSPAQGRGQVDISETSAQLAHGRLTGRASLGFGGGSRLEGQIRFNNVDLHNLMLQSTDLTQMGNGQVTGRIEFSGTNIRSPADLKANVEASFSQTQAFLFPVLAQMAPFVAPGQGASRFQSGELRGWLSGGLFRVQRLGLSGPTLDLFGAGTITLDGRLNLEVVTSTRNLGINPAVLRLFGMRLPTIGPVPVGLVLQVSDYLSNRSIRLNVTGTLRHPVIQVEPLSMLTEEAVRFFLNRYNVPIP
jgi:hypothetical protein